MLSPMPLSMQLREIRKHEQSLRQQEIGSRRTRSRRSPDHDSQSAAGGGSGKSFGTDTSTIGISDDRITRNEQRIRRPLRHNRSQRVNDHETEAANSGDSTRRSGRANVIRWQSGDGIRILIQITGNIEEERDPRRDVRVRPVLRESLLVPELV